MRQETIDQRSEREAAARNRAVGDPRLRERAAVVLEAARRDWRKAPLVVARALREAHGLPSPERRLLGEMLHGWIRWKRRLTFLAQTESIAPTLVVWLADSWPGGVQNLPTKLLDELRANKVSPGRILDGEGAIARIADPIARLGTRTSYPDWIVRRVVETYGEQHGADLLDAMNRRAPLTVRANRLKGDRDQLAEKLAALGVPSRKTPLAEGGLVLETQVNVYGLEPLQSGWMELQDEGSQLIAELVAPPPRGTVIDACAGAGGKTLAVGAALENRGRLVALDVSEAKLVELRKRARRAGLTNVQADVAPKSGTPEKVPAADRVLVDAPCSGLGVVRRNPETKWRVMEGEPAEMAAKQERLLDAYAPLVRVGGRLVYATCSLLPEENDGVVERFLAAHPSFEPVPVKEVLGKERALQIGDGQRLRLAPHVHDTDGFYAAILRRRS